MADLLERERGAEEEASRGTTEERSESEKESMRKTGKKHLDGSVDEASKVKEEEIDLSADTLLDLEGMEASDPVRMYLREIGHVSLLSPSDEKWHSMKMMAPRYLDETRTGVGGGSLEEAWQDVVAVVFDQVRVNWKGISELCSELGVPTLDLGQLIEEIGEISRPVVQTDGESYLAGYLNSIGEEELGETDELVLVLESSDGEEDTDQQGALETEWDTLTRCIHDLCLDLHLLPGAATKVMVMQCRTLPF